MPHDVLCAIESNFSRIGISKLTPLSQPFKSFLINPSWLIASALPDKLYPDATTPDSPSNNPSPYKIKIVIHPSPIRVAYNTVSTVFPDLLAQHDPDFILHIGMAGGRDCYSLETRAHRDGYRIKDVDDADGFSCGEVAWKREGVPDCLLVAWDEDEVLRRWETGVERGLQTRGFLNAPDVPLPKGVPSPMKSVWGTVGGPPISRAEEHRKKSVVKLSRDAGRFLCEYALFESLSLRWVDANKYKQSTQSQSPSSPPSPQSSKPANITNEPSSTTDSAEARHHHDHHRRDLALERLGKVAFLHVPGWTGTEDVARGAMVAEAAIRALVGSWEDGYRRDRRALAHDAVAEGKKSEAKFTDQNSEVDMGRVTATAATANVHGPRDVGVGIEDLGRVMWRA